MIDFEKRLMNSRLDSPKEYNADEFLARLHHRLSKSKNNFWIVITSLSMLIIVSLMTITQFRDKSIQTEFLSNKEIKNPFETDFWNIYSDSLEYDQEFFNNMTYILLDEGYVWETIELMERFKLSKEGL
tara:strand:+ start:627 stop:1013 length:387 start_codon:yes stop_codon:yes gene_type:complete